MKRFNILLLLVLLLCGSASAQDMRALFLSAPDSILPLLTANNRADCLDFLSAGMRARVTNRLDGTSELLFINDDYLELRNSESSTVQMKLLPRKADTLIAVVKSVCAEACDSRINFYKKDWLPAGNLFVRPCVSDFFAPVDSLESLLRLCDIYLVSLSLSPNDHTLKAEYTMPHYMSKEDSALVAPKLRALYYSWEGGRFVRE